MKLTDLTLRAIKPTGKQHALMDDAFPNFGVRVGVSGKLTFFVQYRAGGQRKRETLGHYPILSLSEARDRARKALYEAKYVPAPKRASITYSDAVDKYLRQRKGELRHGTWLEYERHLTKNFTFKDLLDDIEPHEILDALDRIKGKTDRANAYTALKIFINWCIQRDYLQHSPMAKLKKPKVPSSRERVLDDDELAAIWNALHDWPDQRYALIIKLLMVTGQRKGQFAFLHEGWIDYTKRIIRFPREAMKNGEPHTLLFGQLTEFLLRQAQPIHGWYFSPPGEHGRPFTAWSKNKAALDKKLRIDPWTIHDLRRTFSTNCPRLGISEMVTELVTAHKAPMGKIAAAYNRWKYEDEKREAVVRMESHITELVTP